MGTDSVAYLHQFHRHVVPFLEDTDAVIVSAGYDGHERDPMQLLRLKESTYTEMASALKEIGCPLLFLLEGGYRPDVLASCVEATLKPWMY
jgi:acetoin utilization deacetylase AcuC-like enzyme